MAAPSVRVTRAMLALGFSLTSVFGGAVSRAAPLPERAVHAGRPRFQAEASAFIEAEASFIALQVEVPYAELSFRRADDGFAAEFEIIVHIHTSEREVLADAWPERVVIDSRRELWGREQRFRRTLLFQRPPGPYRLEVTLAEPASGHSGKLQLGVQVPFRVPGQLLLSSILIGDCGLAGRLAELRSDPRVRSDFRELPPSLCAYAELYHPGRSGGTLILRWQLISEGAGILHATGVDSFAAGDELTRLSWALPLGERTIDAYRLNAQVIVDTTELRAATSFRVQTGSDPPLGRFFRESLDALAYIADTEEVRLLRMAAPDERQRLWDEFWARRDPTPETEENEFKRQFFARLNFVNSEFGFGRPGWQSDRGRIYIVHGPPEQIERYPFRVDGPPMEIWHYERLGRSFVFIDRNGFGNYTLVSTE